jgi:hypothetical protein
MLSWRASLTAEKFDEHGDDLTGRCSHEPMPEFANHHAFDIRRHKPACGTRNSPEAFSPVRRSGGAGF